MPFKYQTADNKSVNPLRTLTNPDPAGPGSCPYDAGVTKLHSVQAALQRTPRRDDGAAMQVRTGTVTGFPSQLSLQRVR